MSQQPLDSPSLSILIPAAGSSERLGQAKQLVQYKGNSLLGNAVNSAHSMAPREIIVVTGAHSEAVRNAVQHPTVRWVHNPHWSAGMGGSIAIGVAAISRESAGLMILLCDQWLINTRDLDLLVKTWSCAPERIVVSEAEGHCMPPVVAAEQPVLHYSACIDICGCSDATGATPG